VRELTITQPDTVISVNLLRQDVTINRVDHVEYTSSTGSRYRQSGVVEIPFLENRGEPLALELGEFVRAIEDGDSPRVSGADGLLALRQVKRVIHALRP
jgi:predicted dehydrogenase